MNFNESLEIKRKNAESILKNYLPDVEGNQSLLFEAMEYSAMSGGKRLRPVIMGECYHLFGGKTKVIEPFMAAIEMIHSYSLVHDDLPAMDNDEYRRGKLTCWKKFGEANAILAGDALLNYAYETASKAFEMAQDEKELKAVGHAMRILSEKAGAYGMVGGQTVDVLSENDTNVSLDTLMFIHENKTAALIQAAMMVGATLAGAKDKDILDLERAGLNIGIAFQIQDDVLDVTSTTEELGKPVGSDAKNGKVTYVTLKGLEESKKAVKEMSEEAIEILQDISDENRADGSFLMTLVETLINREK